MKKSVEIILLPTNTYTGVVLHSTGLDNMLHTKESAKKAVLDIGGQHQNVYVTVSQDIENPKNGDWCSYTHPDSPDRVMITQIKNWNYTRKEPNYAVRHTEGYGVVEGYRKIIATTDSKLLKEINIPFGQPNHHTNTFNGTIIQRSGKHYTFLPQLSQPFLKEFVSNPSGKWEVEYEECHFICAKGLGTSDCVNICCQSPNLKINEDNTVNITFLDNSFTIKDAKKMVDAWESLPEGEYDSETISNWLIDDMKPVIDMFRLKIKGNAI